MSLQQIKKNMSIKLIFYSSPYFISIISAYSSYINIKKHGTNIKNKNPHFDWNTDQAVPHLWIIFDVLPMIYSLEKPDPFS